MSKSSAPLMVIIVIGLIGCIVTSNLLFAKTSKVSPSELHRPTMFFAGMDKFLSQVNWMALIQWEASHTDLDDPTSELLYRKFNALTNLDPLFTDGYLTGALSLAPHKPKHALELIDKAMTMGLNNDWKVPFYGGFISMIYLRDYKQAEKYFQIATQLPDCPNHIRRELIRSQCLQKPNDKLYSLTLWSDYYKSLSPSEQKNQSTVSYEIISTGQELVTECEARLQSETQDELRKQLAQSRDDALAIMAMLSPDEVKRIKDQLQP